MSHKRTTAPDRPPITPAFDAMTDRDPAPDRIAIEMTRNGSAADLSALLTWIQETFDEEDYSLALDFQTTDSFEFEGPASLPTGEAFASAAAPPSSDDQDRDETDQEYASENVDADDDQEADDEEETDEDAPETAVSEFEEGDRVRHTGGENGAGKVEKPNPEFGTVLVRFDAGYIRGVRPDRLAHVEDAAATSTAETDEGADKTFPLSPGTRKYRVASTLSALSGEGDPTTSRDVFEALAGTEWEEETVDKVSQAVTHLYEDDAVDRVGRGQSNAYLYTLSLSGESVVAQVEEAAETTFADVRDAWVADHAADDVDASQDTSADTEADTEEGTGPECYACGEDLPESWSAEEGEDYPPDCPTCGENPLPPVGDTEDEEEDDESAPVTERVTLNPGTWRFKVGSALYHRDGPQTPNEIEAALSGTEWERSRKHVSGNLGSIYRDDVATREKQQTEIDGPDPYAYELTEEGEELIEDAARRAVENGYLVFSDVVEDSDTEDGADESDATGDAGLDRLLGDDAEEAGADDDEDDEEGLSSLFDGVESDPEDPYESSLERAMSGVDATQD